jgi:hypothetical protein
MPRKLLRVFSHIEIAEIVAQELRSAGYQAVAMRTQDAGGYNPMALAEVFLEDDEVLENPEDAAAIEAIVAGQDIPPEAEADIVAMEQPKIDTSLEAAWMARILIAFLAIVALVVVSYFVFGRR